MGQPGEHVGWFVATGGEIGQWNEWHHDGSVEWHLLQYPLHRGIQRWLTDLNRLYRQEPALHELDERPEGFSWVDANDSANCVLTMLRTGQSTGAVVLIACNFTPVPRHHYRVGVPRGGTWREVLNSDAYDYSGSGIGNRGSVQAEAVPYHGRPFSVDLTLPPLSKDADIWMHPTDYAPCQQLADRARTAGVDLIKYRSARDPDRGLNLAILSCGAFVKHEPVSRQSWRIQLSAGGVRALCEFPRLFLDFDRNAFARDPRMSDMTWDR